MINEIFYMNGYGLYLKGVNLDGFQTSYQGILRMNKAGPSGLEKSQLVEISDETFATDLINYLQSLIEQEINTIRIPISLELALSENEKAQLRLTELIQTAGNYGIMVLLAMDTVKTISAKNCAQSKWQRKGHSSFSNCFFCKFS